VYELLTVSPAIRRLIVPHCEAEGIQDIALSEGMASITRNAVELARSGTISLGEAFRLRAD
jgi:type IV pilus assembly protein PilB